MQFKTRYKFEGIIIIKIMQGTALTELEIQKLLSGSIIPEYFSLMLYGRLFDKCDIRISAIFNELYSQLVIILCIIFLVNWLSICKIYNQLHGYHFMHASCSQLVIISSKNIIK